MNTTENLQQNQQRNFQATSRPRVLICEDDATTLLALKRAYEMLGCQVHTAMSGCSALSRLRSGSYDLVLMDFHLPLLNAADVMAEVSDYVRRRNPIVLISSEDHRADFAALGFKAFESKPLTMDDARRLLGVFAVPELPMAAAA